MNKATAAYYGFITGTFGVTLVAAFVILGGAFYPGYSHMSQFISELGALEAPNRLMVSFAGYLPAGLLICCFSFLAAKALPHSKLSTAGFLGIACYAIGWIAASFFPCDPGCLPEHPSVSQQIHNIVGGSGYFLGPMGVFLLGISARQWQGADMVSLLGFVSAIISLAAVLAVPIAPALTTYAGLFQRITEASFLGWVLVCAFHLRKISIAHKD